MATTDKHTMFDKELEFFVANQERLVAEHAGKVLVIRDGEVAGVYDSALNAYLDAEERFSSGTYMIQPCESGPAAYTVTIAPVFQLMEV